MTTTTTTSVGRSQAEEESSDHRYDMVDKMQRRQGPVGDRLEATSWNIDAILPPSADPGMVYEDLPPIAAAIQGAVLLVWIQCAIV